MSGFSLRESLARQGITDPKDIAHHLGRAMEMQRTVPGFNIRRYRAFTTNVKVEKPKAREIEA